MGKGGDSSSAHRTPHLLAASNDGRYLVDLSHLRIRIHLLTRLVDLWIGLDDLNDGRDLNDVRTRSDDLRTCIDDLWTRLDDLWTRLDDLNDRRNLNYLRILIDDLRTHLDHLRNRLFAFVSRLSQTAPATEGTEPETPSSKARSRLLGIINWGMAPVIGILAGIFHGGSKKAAAPVSKDAEVTLKLGSTPDKREQYRLMRGAMEKRLIRITRGSIIGGVCLGMFTAAFFGLRNLFAKKKVPGSPRWRLRSVLLGSILGAAFCFPAGWVHLKLVGKANEGNHALDSSTGRRQVVELPLPSRDLKAV